MMANRLASVIAYREGIDFLDGMEPVAIANMGIRYLREENRIRSLIEGLESADIPDRETVISRLRLGGVRAGLWTP